MRNSQGDTSVIYRTFGKSLLIQCHGTSIQGFPSRHRDLSNRAGIHTYLGCSIRKGGPQLSVYISPEVFAPERNIS
jgi:hypothetical protein